MKNVLYAGLFGSMSLNVYAADLSANVLAEHATYVGFAPAEYRGVFKLQLLSNGVIQKVDNQNHTTRVAKLSEQAVKNVKFAIDHIKSDELTTPEGSQCVDAPSHDIRVRQANATNMTLWERVNCRDANPTDITAIKVVRLMNSLEDSLSQLDSLAYLNKVDQCP